MWRPLISLSLAVMLSNLAAAQQSRDQEARFRVRVDVVEVSVAALDSRGQFVFDLEAKEFEVTDNGVRQKIFDLDLSPQPVSLVVLVDTSSRVAPLLDRVRGSGILFTEVVMGQTGEGAVITFDSGVHLLQNFTSDGDKIITAIKKIQPGDDGARLADALGRAVEMLRTRENRRRVVMAMTEPDDRGSLIQLGEPLRQAQLANVSIYTIGFNTTQAMLMQKEARATTSPFPPGVMARPLPPGVAPTPTAEQQYYGGINLIPAVMMLVQTLSNSLGQNPLKVLAAGTGASYRSQLTKSGLEEAISEIGNEIHSQYVLTYRPTNAHEPGFHRIVVQVKRSGITVRARPGYFISPAS